MVPQRIWPLLAAWNSPGIVAFATAFAAAKTRERENASWALTLGDWLPTLGLSQAQWEGMLLPWAASLFSGDIDQARGLSARAAMIFAASAVPANPLEPTVYYVLKHGMAEVLKRLIEQTTTVGVLTSAPVLAVSREPGAPGIAGTTSGQFKILCLDGRTLFVDDLVLASSGPGSLRLLGGPAGTDLQQAALRGIEFHDAVLALHLDPFYAAADPRLWSFLNCGIHGSFCEASMWLASVLPEARPETAATIWKSWITHRAAAGARAPRNGLQAHAAHAQRRSSRRPCSADFKAAAASGSPAATPFPTTRRRLRSCRPCRSRSASTCHRRECGRSCDLTRP